MFSREPLREFCPILEDLSPVYGTVTIPLHSPPNDVVTESTMPGDDAASGDDDLQFGKD